MRKSILTCLVAAVVAVGIASAFAQKRIADTKQRPQQRTLLRQRSQSRLPGITPSVAFIANPEKSSVSIPGPNTMLGGIMVYSDAWLSGTNAPGAYSIQARDGGALTKLYGNNDMLNIISATKVNNTLYAIALDRNTYKVYVQEYSATTWSRSRNEETDMVNLASALAYDPTTGKVYGAFYNEDNQYWDRFCSYSTSLGEATNIKTVDRDITALAFNSAGELYGIWGASSWLIKIDKKTGSYEQIGKTGLYPVLPEDYGVNSMAFGSDGVLYWSATYEGTSSKDLRGGLFSVDTATGKATKIMDYPNNEAIAGLFAMASQVPTTAPDAVTNIAVNYTSDFATTATISFDAPTKTVNGAALTESIMAIVEVDGALATVVENIQPGASATSAQITLTEGSHKIAVTAANATERGNIAETTTWTGEDVPASPTDVVAETVDGRPTVSWTAPVAGVNGGKFDAASLRYKVVRYPDETVVAEACTDCQFVDASLPANMKTAYYEVSAFTGKGSSAPVASNKVAVGDGYVVPFVEQFATQDDFDAWTIIDNNGGSKWEYKNQALFYNYNNDYISGDDWAISPKIALQSGVTYKLTFFSKSSNYTKYYENFKVAIGSKPSVSEMTVLKDYPNYQNKNGETQSIVFSVAADGYYYVGFYSYSDGKKGWSLTIDNFGISEVSNNVPGAVQNLSVTAGDKGAMKAIVAFTAPKVDAKGGTIETPMKIDIYRADKTEAVYSIAEVQPGATKSWTDETMTDSDVYTYRVVASNTAGEGADAKASAFVGVDVPGAVGNLTLKDVDGNAVIAWTAPTVGSRGGWFDPTKVTYRVLRSDGTVVAVDYTATSYTDSALPVSDTQQLIYYVVTSYSNDKKGDYAVTPYGVFGDAYNAPLTEGFAGSDMAYYPWITESDQDVHQSWTLQDSGSNPSTADQNGDKGLATFHSIGENAGIHTSFSSPKINITKLSAPALSFWMYHSHDEAVTTAESIEVKVMTEQGEWQSVEGAKWMRDNGTTGWQRHLVDLSAFKSAKWVRIAFVGTTAGGMDVHIDNVSVDNLAAIDAELTSVSGPKKIAAGEQAEYEVKVTNVGTDDIAGATLMLTDASGKTLAQAEAGAVKAGEQKTLTLSTTFESKTSVAVTATVTAAGDTNAPNNAKTVTTEVVEPVVPVPQNLGCVLADGGLKLSWQSPLSKGAVTDNVESYKDWAIDNIGDWTMADLDHDVTYYINKDLGEYDNASVAKAFQVCNANTLGVDIWDEGKPHSGNKMFMAMASMNYVNNDWLISPRLNGGEQTISFYARSFTLQDQQPERMRVLYSTTDTDPANFQKIHSADYLELTDQWSEFSYVVPEGARYFAVNCVSDSGFAMFVDDLSFNDLTVPKLNVKEYEVYRNGSLLGKTTDMSIVDANVVSGTVYTVKAVYDKTVSGNSESLTYIEGGVEALDANAPRVATGKGFVEVLNADGKHISVHATDGKTVYTGTAYSPRYSIPASAGVYVVTIDGKSVKAIVK